MALAAVLMLPTLDAPAGASPTPAPPAPTATRTRVIWVPGQPPSGPYTPVVVPVQVVTSDLEGAAQVAQSAARVDVVLDANILFGKDSDVLQPAALARLQEVAKAIAGGGRPGRLAVDGYTDDLGSAEHGLDLSRRRAAAVEAVLRPALPASIVITATGHGEASPAYPNTSEANRAKNRRVELHFVAS